LEMKIGASHLLKPKKMQIVAVVRGQIEIKSNLEFVNLFAGQFSLIPAILERAEIIVKSNAALLRVEAN
jgi:hypothetical protein